MGSDHFPIQIKINKQNLIKSPTSHRIGTSRVDWHIFTKELSTFHYKRPPLVADNYIQEYEQFNEDIKSALIAAGALMLDANGQRPCPRVVAPAIWWDQECAAAVANRRAALHKYLKQSTQDNLKAYELSVKETSKKLKEKKRQDGKYFVTH